MMINSIQITNFQSHEDTELEFSPGVNVLVGPSDSGKTAIVRALRWLVWNRPQGEAFRSNWGGDTEVTLFLNDKFDDYGGDIISRSRAKDNSYSMGKLTLGFKDEFKAIRAEVPEEIEQALNLDEINLQQQLDRPFLLDESPGEVAKHFNKIAHLDVIDRGLQNVQRDIRQFDQNISSSESQLESLKEDLVEFDYLEELETKIQRLEQLDKTRDALLQESDDLEECISQIQRVEDELKKYDKILGLSEIVNSTLELFKGKASLMADIGELEKHLFKIESTENSVSVVQKSLGKMEQEFKDNFPEICPFFEVRCEHIPNGGA